MTYVYNLCSQGVLDKGQVVGHETASIFDQDMRKKLQEQRELSQEEQARAYMSGRKKKTLSAFQTDEKGRQRGQGAGLNAFLQSRPFVLPLRLSQEAHTGRRKSIKAPMTP